MTLLKEVRTIVQDSNVTWVKKEKRNKRIQRPFAGLFSILESFIFLFYFSFLLFLFERSLSGPLAPFQAGSYEPDLVIVIPYRGAWSWRFKVYSIVKRRMRPKQTITCLQLFLFLLQIISVAHSASQVGVRGNRARVCGVGYAFWHCLLI